MAVTENVIGLKLIIGLKMDMIETYEFDKLEVERIHLDPKFTSSIKEVRH